jgi:hypothetical protein
MKGTILLRVQLTQGTTGRARHARNGEPLPTPAALNIVQYASDPGFYLLYLDNDGHELTDTYHDSLSEAMAQAEWELAVTPRQWISADD